jgi:uncharacterized protein YuzE
MRVTYDDEANAAYIELEDDVAEGSSVENVLVERPGRGDIVLDFDAHGRSLGVEILGARNSFTQRFSTPPIEPDPRDHARHVARCRRHESNPVDGHMQRS